MGRRIVALALAEPKRFALAGAVERAGEPDLGKDAGRLAGGADAGVPVTDDLGAALSYCDVVIDFSLPMAAVAHAQACRRAKKAVVIGTTGLDARQETALRGFAKTIPLLLSPNMSAGVNLVFDLAARAAAMLPGYDAEIVEIHHRQKVDAPSGTALRLGEVVAGARGSRLDRAGRFERKGTIGPRRSDEIGIQTLRGGDVVGDHTLVLAGPGERIEITHRAHSRDVFAHGALRAAEWLAGRKPGWYGMADVLGLKTASGSRQS
ncbi:MAG: 4-hydroxy-tetrahydrodipicolinate reductase [Nitrospirae bacterium]|nr:4-hydroxy-tetrahydrodipicolinate reductase [Nitrospirota bacterium]